MVRSGISSPLMGDQRKSLMSLRHPLVSCKPDISGNASSEFEFHGLCTILQPGRDSKYHTGRVRRPYTFVVLF